MSISSQINRIKDAKTALIAVIRSKGVEVPDNVSIEELETYAAQIQQGGGVSYPTITHFHADHSDITDVSYYRQRFDFSFNPSEKTVVSTDDGTDALPAVLDSNASMSIAIEEDKLIETLAEYSSPENIVFYPDEGVQMQAVEDTEYGEVGFIYGNHGYTGVIGNDTEVIAVATSSDVAEAIGLTADKIVSGNTVLGIDGTAASASYDESTLEGDIDSWGTAYASKLASGVQSYNAEGNIIQGAARVFDDSTSIFQQHTVDSVSSDPNSEQIYAHSNFNGCYNGNFDAPALLNLGAELYTTIDHADIANAIGLQASQIAKGSTVLGIDGTGGITPETPTITVSSAGLITASANGLNKTQQLTTQSAKTVTPSTSSQTAVASGRYTTGAVTVAAIPSQYIIPSGSQTLTENKTYDVSSLASVIVNVASSEGEGLPSGISAFDFGTITIASDFTTSRQTFKHNLGTTPDLVFVFAPSNVATTYSMLFSIRSNKLAYRSSAYSLYMGYHGNSTTTVSLTNSNSTSYGVSNLTASTFQLASSNSSYYWRAGKYNYIALKFS